MVYRYCFSIGLIQMYWQNKGYQFLLMAFFYAINSVPDPVTWNLYV